MVGAVIAQSGSNAKWPANMHEQHPIHKGDVSNSVYPATSLAGNPLFIVTIVTLLVPRVRAMYNFFGNTQLRSRAGLNTVKCSRKRIWQGAARSADRHDIKRMPA